ncbi:hypothetical protein [Rhizobium sp. SL42]|uniref:hypothetical protein n=1 Tax=Rhizobium sp. SL42 TaxID=2806346 RepID=UPI001F15EDF4|nr:hypothetical protein [Rhizobium sp. SL42]
MKVSVFAQSCVLALLLSASLTAPAQADDIGQLPVTATFVVSGGFWITGPQGAAVAEADADNASSAEGARGYYKLVAIRQPDRTAKIYLQTIAAEEAGPRLVQSVELEEFTALRPYVTGIMPESMTGVGEEPGFMATVYLKTSPQADRAEEWTVLIDDLGDIRVERASN